MATPEIVIGAALLSLFITYKVDLGFTSLFIAHVMFGSASLWWSYGRA